MDNMDEKDKLPEEQGSRGEEAQPSFEVVESKNYVKPKKSKKPLILTLSCTAAVLAAGLGTAFFLSNYNPGNGEITGTLQTVEHKHDFLKSGFILPTCTEEGEYTFSCYCGETVTEKRPPLGHSEEMRERVEPTCTGAGRKEEYFCTVCGESLGGGEEISALGHKEVIDSGRAPTKTEDGLTDGKHCETCGEVLEEQKVIYAGSQGLLCDVADGIWFVTGMGNCTDTELVLPKYIDGYEISGISNGAFAENKNITSAFLQDGITSLGNRAFMGCTSLETVTLPASITSIGEEAFSGCTSLRRIIYGGTTEEFANIVKGSGWNFHLTDYVVSCTDGERGASKGLEYQAVSETECIITSIGTCTDTYIHVPRYMDGYLVTGVGYGAFNGNHDIQAISFRSEIKQIGDYAFYGCKNLHGNEVPDGVTSIGAYAFAGCDNLSYVILPESVTYIGENAFYGCDHLNRVNIPGGVTRIEAGTFSDCFHIEKIEISEGVEYIGSGAFSGIKFMGEINIPKSVTHIGSAAFGGIDHIKVHISDLAAWCKIEFEDATANPLSAYSSELLLNGKAVTEVDIPDGTEYIGDYIFYNFKGLESVNIPASVKAIGQGVFFGCDSLSSVTMEEGTQSIGISAFEDCRSLEIINIPESVTDIGENAFRNCMSLSSVAISKRVKSIGPYAFYACNNLSTLYIEDLASWCEIDFATDESNPMKYAEYVYYGGKLLANAEIPAGITKINDYAFEGCATL
jgi:hypothetical protein